MTKSLAIQFEICDVRNFAGPSILFNCTIQSCGTLIAAPQDTEPTAGKQRMLVTDLLTIYVLNGSV